MDTFFVDLNHLGLLAVKGEDSGKFLQGQLTCDINTASSSNFIYGAVCNNKGRVQSSFLLLHSEDTFYLEMQPGLLESTKANLDKYIVFSKASTANAGPEFDRIGVAGQQAEELLQSLFPSLPDHDGALLKHDGHFLLRRNGAKAGVLARYELWLQSDNDSEIRSKLETALPRGSDKLWLAQDIRQGIYHLEAQQIDLHTPQPLNYDLTGRISFTKGCYTGQEIVARMHYRGTPKKRLYAFRLPAGSTAATSGENTIIAPATGKQAGELLQLIKLEGAQEGLAILTTDLVEADHDLALKASPADSLEIIHRPGQD